MSSRLSIFGYSAVLGCAAVLLAQPAWARPIACPPGDNATIQGCIDGARPGDDIVFSGIYHIDPSQSPVTLENASGIRLLGDAARPALFRCELAADGRPTEGALVNDAFQVLASDSRVSGVVFDGLHFQDCGTAIFLRAVGTGSFANIEILDVDISNVYFGVLVKAPVDGLAIRGSRISNAERAIALDDPDVDRVARDVEITGNVLHGLQTQPARIFQSGIFLSGVVDGKISGNVVSGFSQLFNIPGLGIAALNFDAATTSLDIVHNVVTVVRVGLSLGGTAPSKDRVEGNSVKGATTAGIMVRAGANGRRIGFNELAGNAVDVRLTGVGTPVPEELGTSDNVVHLTPGQTYEDYGIDNCIVVHQR